MFSMDKAPIKGRICRKAEEAPPEVLEAARLSEATFGKWHGGLERFKLGRVDLGRLEDIDESVKFGPRDVILVSFGPHYKNASLAMNERSAVLLRLDETRKDRRRATLIWRENSATHFPVASGTHEEMMQLNYDGAARPTPQIV